MDSPGVHTGPRAGGGALMCVDGRWSVELRELDESCCCEDSYVDIM